MSEHYEKYVWIIDNIVAYMREENSYEDRMKYLNYILDQTLKRMLDAGLLTTRRECSKCG